MTRFNARSLYLTHGARLRRSTTRFPNCDRKKRRVLGILVLMASTVNGRCSDLSLATINFHNPHQGSKNSSRFQRQTLHREPQIVISS